MMFLWQQKLLNIALSIINAIQFKTKNTTLVIVPKRIEKRGKIDTHFLAWYRHSIKSDGGYGKCMGPSFQNSAAIMFYNLREHIVFLCIKTLCYGTVVHPKHWGVWLKQSCSTALWFIYIPIWGRVPAWALVLSRNHIFHPLL